MLVIQTLIEIPFFVFILRKWSISDHFDISIALFRFILISAGNSEVRGCKRGGV